ncbi:MAG: alpha-L-fucosidase [Bacteroidetes bacterium]|nr:alpha-L-fucosidase [Bacteroidota bacterium]
MQIDTLSYDSLDSRPLPEWLVDQKSGITTIEPEEIVMKEDHSLTISFIATGLFIILLVVLITLYINRKHKNQVT